MSGWIKLHRDIIKHWIFNKPEYLKAWITIIINANHEEKKVFLEGELIDCKRGQSLKSLQSWSKLFGAGWSIQKVRTFFKLLKADKMINLEGLRKTTRLTVCNYEKYQNQQHRDNTEITQRQHRDNTQATTNKNDKNVNNEKNEKNIYMGFSENLISTIKNFKDMRKKIRKPLTEKAEELMLKRLHKIGNGNESDMIEILEYSIMNSYQGIFELNKNNGKKYEQQDLFSQQQKTQYTSKDENELMEGLTIYRGGKKVEK
jgi:hypothetical protein